MTIRSLVEEKLEELEILKPSSALASVPDQLIQARTVWVWVWRKLGGTS